MLGNDKTFHDRLSWVLALPIAGLASGAVYLAFLAVEVAAEGDAIGSAAWWISPARALACAFVAARVGASIAPARKFWAAAGIGAAFAIFAARLGPGATSAAGAAFGAAGGAWTARKLPDDPAEAAAPEKG